MTDLTYTWVIDVGYAWLRIPLSDNNLDGITPSGDSYIDKTYIYLGRNSDASQFLLRYAREHFTRPRSVKLICKYPAYVRNLRRCAQQLELF